MEGEAGRKSRGTHQRRHRGSGDWGSISGQYRQARGGDQQEQQLLQHGWWGSHRDLAERERRRGRREARLRPAHSFDDALTTAVPQTPTRGGPPTAATPAVRVAEPAFTGPSPNAHSRPLGHAERVRLGSRGVYSVAAEVETFEARRDHLDRHLDGYQSPIDRYNHACDDRWRHDLHDCPWVHARFPTTVFNGAGRTRYYDSQTNIRDYTGGQAWLGKFGQDKAEAGSLEHEECGLSWDSSCLEQLPPRCAHGGSHAGDSRPYPLISGPSYDDLLNLYGHGSARFSPGRDFGISSWHSLTSGSITPEPYEYGEDEGSSAPSSLSGRYRMRTSHPGGAISTPGQHYTCALDASPEGTVEGGVMTDRQPRADLNGNYNCGLRPGGRRPCCWAVGREGVAETAGGIWRPVGRFTPSGWRLVDRAAGGAEQREEEVRLGEGAGGWDRLGLSRGGGDEMTMAYPAQSAAVTTPKPHTTTTTTSAGTATNTTDSPVVTTTSATTTSTTLCASNFAAAPPPPEAPPAAPAAPAAEGAAARGPRDDATCRCGGGRPRPVDGDCLSGRTVERHHNTYDHPTAAPTTVTAASAAADDRDACNFSSTNQVETTTSNTTPETPTASPPPPPPPPPPPSRPQLSRDFATIVGKAEGRLLPAEQEDIAPASVTSRGHYHSIPIVRVHLAEDSQDEEAGKGDVGEPSPRGDRLSPVGVQSDADQSQLDCSSSRHTRRSARGNSQDSMDRVDSGGSPSGETGGIQAIDLEELHRRRKMRHKRKSKYIKNVLVLSFAFVSIFSATSGLTLLQSSLNRRMGVFGLCANFLAVAVSCLLLPKALIQLVGCKRTVVVSMLCFVLWVMANMQPGWATLLPAAVVMGAGWAPLWTAQCTYFTVTGIEYAKWADDMPDVVIARTFGVFFMIFMTAPIWGNLLSSSVLSHGHFHNRSRPLPLPGDPDSIYRFCGAADCPDTYDNITNENYNLPEKSLVYTLVGLYLGLCLIGLTLVAFFLDSLDLDREAGKPRCAAKSLMASLKQMRNPYQVFIIPLTVYTGMEQVFLMVEYTRAYATCALGMEKIGYVVMSYAAVAAVMSLACSQLVNVVGRMPLFLIGAGAHIGCMVVFMRWTPYPDSLIMFIIMPAIWGIGDAIWQSQINAFYGVLFSDQSEAAFSNYRMWESVGFVMSLSYSPFLCVYLKIYLLLGWLVAGLLGYFVVEGLYSKASSELETELARKGEPVEADSATEPEAPFSAVAQMIRRKSSVYIPQRTVREAAEVMRRKSQVLLGGVENPERIIRRRLSTFAPVPEVTEEATPLSSICSTPIVHQRASAPAALISDAISASSNLRIADAASPVVAATDLADGAMDSISGADRTQHEERERRNGRITPPARDALSRVTHYDV